MSTTRRTENKAVLRQERYASDPAFQDHLKASAVARKCRLLSNPEHKEICLYLQHASMQQGGLSKMVTDFLKRYSDRLGSRAMREHRTNKTFSADLVRIIREELRCAESFRLKGEIDGLRELFASSDEILSLKLQAQHLPAEYQAAAFHDWCLCHAEEQLENWLVSLCLDPAVTLENPPGWFYELERSLRDYIADRREDGLAGKIVTSIGAQINDALDYAFDEKCMVLINGVARMGKTYQVEQWCNAYPGRVRYVQVPSGNDEISFYRAIARALGTASGSAMNSRQIKRNVEDAIQDAGIMLVFDEAHYLWPQYKGTRNSPRRINWILTEVVNKNIPVALVTTPQFDFLQNTIVNVTGWASEQLDGRISYRLDLPSTLPESDLAAIVKFNLPDADRQIIDGLCAYAQSSGKFIAGIEAVAKRARFLAKKTGRTAPNKTDLVTAMKEVDPAIVNIKPSEEEKQSACTPPATAQKRTCRRTARAMQPHEKELVAAH
jgi:hypothetical protein